MVNSNNYFNNKKVIKEPGKDDVAFQDPHFEIEEVEEVIDQDYQNPSKVVNLSLEDEFKRKNKNTR